MAIASKDFGAQPMSEMNTTPLIDVMLVLLIMFIITIPIASNVTPIDLGGDTQGRTVDPVVNRVVVTADDRILWNGGTVSERGLSALLAQTVRLPVEPELQFQPEAQASYDLAAKVTSRIERSGVTKFGVVGNERYSEFSTSS